MQAIYAPCMSVTITARNPVFYQPISPISNNLLFADIFILSITMLFGNIFIFIKFMPLGNLGICDRSQWLVMFDKFQNMPFCWFVCIDCWFFLLSTSPPGTTKSNNSKKGLSLKKSKQQLNLMVCWFIHVVSLLVQYSAHCDD